MQLWLLSHEQLVCLFYKRILELDFLYIFIINQYTEQVPSKLKN